MEQEFVTKENHELKYNELITFLSNIQKDMREVNTRLFKDNGNISIQTRLDRHGQALKILGWVMALMCSAVILNLGEKIVEHFIK